MSNQRSFLGKGGPIPSGHYSEQPAVISARWGGSASWGSRHPPFTERPCLQRVSKHVPLFHLYHKITRASPPGNEVLDQGGPLVRKAAPHTHAIGNKVCFSVMKGAVIPNHEEFCPKLCLALRREQTLTFYSDCSSVRQWLIHTQKPNTKNSLLVPVGCHHNCRMMRSWRDRERHKRAQTLFSLWSLWAWCS